MGVWGIIDGCLVQSHWGCQSMKDAIVFTYGRQQTVDTANSLELAQMNKKEEKKIECAFSHKRE